MILALSLPADSARVTPIVDEMIEAGLDLYWERTTADAVDWTHAETRLAGARAVVLFFGKGAASGDPANDAFLDLARKACAANKAIAVMLDEGAVPPDLDCTVYDLSGWRASPRGWRAWLVGDSYTRDVISAARYKAAGRDPMAPTAPRKLLLRQVAVASSALLIPAVAVISFTDAVVGLWRNTGMADVASAEESASWNAIEPGSCDGLRAHVERFPDGVYADQASNLLEARSVGEETVMVPAERPLPVYVGAGSADPAPSRAAAEDNVRRLAGEEAQRACSGLAQAVEGELLDTTIDNERLTCSATGAAQSCALDGQAVCRIAEPEVRQVERCGTP